VTNSERDDVGDSSERQNQQRMCNLRLLRPVGARFGGTHENATAAHHQQADRRQTSERPSVTYDQSPQNVNNGNQFSPDISSLRMSYLSELIDE